MEVFRKRRQRSSSLPHPLNSLGRGTSPKSASLGHEDRGHELGKKSVKSKIFFKISRIPTAYKNVFKAQ